MSSGAKRSLYIMYIFYVSIDSIRIMIIILMSDRPICFVTSLVLNQETVFFWFNMNKRVRLIEIYHGEFHNYDLGHTQHNLQLSLFIRGELKA